MRDIHQRLLKQREEALNDPNNPISKMRSNYYRNNYAALNGLNADVFVKESVFPLGKLVSSLENEHFHELIVNEAEEA